MGSLTADEMNKDKWSEAAGSLEGSAQVRQCLLLVYCKQNLNLKVKLITFK